ncbi:alpha/beta hydrolase [Nonomuraea sp. MG754425]|uniref:alpha/beta hydrolase n=1 Tax=Nonomuraea sp. MG754425 TaxID=2570319 RepID=UPI001F370BF3|nr:alpha/beta hydrolase [Nonomuraea sp. MG754425]MCF6473173.1 alpha/beta hydrolase [Nonomuraea sp. MG754425]
MVQTQLLEEPGFAEETAALLASLSQRAELSDYRTLLAARAGSPDPALSGRLDPSVRVADLYLPARGGPVRARIYQERTMAGPRPVLLWLHGGGFIGGSADDLDHVCSRLANLAKLTVVSLDYRLAPEHPHPAALFDTYDAIGWLAEHGSLIGGDGRIAAGGQSAGAALVAGACLMARDHAGPAVSRQILCYPVLDFGQDTESFREFDGVFLSIKPGRWSERQYLAGQQVTPYAAPLRAETLAGLPPALVIGAGRDPLRDDARGYAARLDAEGVEVRHVEFAGTMHAFLNFCGVLSAGRHAIDLIATELTRVFPTDVTGLGNQTR